LTDKCRSGRPVEFDDKALDTLLQVNPCQTTRELATQFNCSHITVKRHLHALGKINK
jgi:predicted transcriptional regulator